MIIIIIRLIYKNMNTTSFNLYVKIDASEWIKIVSRTELIYSWLKTKIFKCSRYKFFKKWHCKKIKLIVVTIVTTFWRRVIIIIDVNEWRKWKYREYLSSIKGIWKLNNEQEAIVETLYYLRVIILSKSALSVIRFKTCWDNA